MTDTAADITTQLKINEAAAANTSTEVVQPAPVVPPSIAYSKYTFWGMITVLVVVVVIIGVSLKRLHQRVNTDFNLFDLIMQDGKASRVGITFMGTWLLSCWIMGYLVLTGKLTEQYFLIFNGSWVVPLTARVIFGAKTAPTPEVLKEQTTD